jgi:hypothetical protein
LYRIALSTSRRMSIVRTLSPRWRRPPSRGFRNPPGNKDKVCKSRFEEKKKVMSPYRTAVDACSWFAKHAGALATLVAIVCTAAVCPLPLHGQWTPGPGPISYTGGNVGIGTTNPTSKLMVTHSSPFGFYAGFYSPALTIQNLDTSAYNASQIVIKDSSGLDTAGFSFRNLAHGASGSSDFGLVLRNSGTLFVPLSVNNSGNVGIGTTNPCATNAPANCKLSVAGAIQAYEVVVNTSWSDYVFHPAYRLKPLTEVAAYIQRNHHLPGIPSAAEVRENGVSVGEMQSKLLAKIEELTLHAIQSEERNTRLEQQNRDLQERMARLEGRTAHAQPAPDRPAAAPARH